MNVFVGLLGLRHRHLCINIGHMVCILHLCDLHAVLLRNIINRSNSSRNLCIDFTVILFLLYSYN